MRATARAGMCAGTTLFPVLGQGVSQWAEGVCLLWSSHFGHGFMGIPVTPFGLIWCHSVVVGMRSELAVIPNGIIRDAMFCFYDLADH